MDNSPTLFPLEEFNIKKWSYSKIALFKQCKFRYKAKYLDKKLNQDQRPIFYTNVGRVVHNVLSSLFEPNYESIKNEKPIEDLVKNNWISDGYVDYKEEKYWFDKSVSMISSFIQNSPFSGKPIVIEGDFENQIGDLIITSRIDRIDNVGNKEYEIIDYKVGSEESTTRKGFEKYQWAFLYLSSREILQERYKMHARAITFYYLESGFSESIEPKNDLVEEAISKITSIVQEIKRENLFPPTINNFCSDCKFDIICPAMIELKRRK